MKAGRGGGGGKNWLPAISRLGSIVDGSEGTETGKCGGIWLPKALG